jgi:predicted nucleotide-binding protein
MSRNGVIPAIADYFLDLREREADELLRAAGSSAVTPSGWGAKSLRMRRAIMIGLVGQQSSSVIETLQTIANVDSLPATQPQLSVEQVTNAPETSSVVDPAGEIFLVHGHGDAARHECARVLERITDRSVTILHEQPNSGNTILEKFEDNAARAAYAVVLLTADDIGGAGAAAEQRPRGRQNVIFELGFFFGKLGRRRVAVLLEAGIERPSDIDGLVYISLDAAGAWKASLARELAEVGINVDYTRMP